MKYSVFILLLIGLVSCKQEPEVALKDRVYNFKVSECRADCGRDSIGVRENRIVGGDLKVRLGYVVNCSWDSAWVDNIERRNDSLFLRFDRAHTIDTISVDGDEVVTEMQYVMTDCDCFYFFEFKLKDVETTPAVVRVEATFEKFDYWDQRPIRNYVEPEEIEYKEAFPDY